MVIPSSLPVLPAPLNSNDNRPRNPSNDRSDSESSVRNNNRNVQFIARTDGENNPGNNDSSANFYNQRVNPANRSALLSYSITESSSLGQPTRTGRYLDMYL